MRVHRFIAFLPLAALLVAACSGSEAGDGASKEPPPTDPAATEPAVTAAPVAETVVSEPLVSEPVETDVPAATTAPETTAPESTTAVAPEVYDFSAIGPVVDGFVAEQGLNGAGLIVVDRDDGVVHEQYWGEFGADRVSLIASSSKMVSASVLWRLHDDGMLDMDAPVADVVEWGVGNPDVTPAQLISNSSGLVGLLPDPTYAPYLCQYIATGTLQQCAEQIFTTAEDDADVIQPDTEFRYGGAQWTVAGAVAEAASGKTWAELVDEFVTQPCGLESLQYNNHFAQIGAGGFDYPVEFNSDPSTLAATDNPNPEAGVYVTVPDYGQLMLMQLRGGRCGDVQVVSSEAIERMHADRIAEAYDGDAGSAATGYGMGWWVDRDSGRISDSGAYGTVPWLDLDGGFGAYLVVEANTAVGGSLAAQLYEPVEAAVLAAN